MGVLCPSSFISAGTSKINAQQDEQKRLLKKLERQQERLLDKLLDGTIDDDTYRQRRAQMDFDLISARDELHDRKLEAFDLQGVLNLAEHALTNAAMLWQELPDLHRVRFQKALFPHGLSYGKDQKFGTAANAYL